MFSIINKPWVLIVKADGWPVVCSTWSCYCLSLDSPFTNGDSFHKSDYKAGIMHINVHSAAIMFYGSLVSSQLSL